MLHWLSSWLREIILVILLASFVDLILPSNKMQRYVKVVISLFILMTILSPVVSLLKVEWDFEQLNNEFQLEDINTNGYEPMSNIVEEGETLKGKNEQQTNQIVQTKIEEMVYTQLVEQMSLAVQSVNVDLSIEANNEPKVNEMTIILKSQTETNSTLDASEIQPIEEVQPVVIDIQLNDMGENDLNDVDEQSNKAGETTEEMKQLEIEVTSFLVSQWDISSDQINVIYESQHGL
ncbi:stage III sporulation protein AF [Chengkuizengella axinellae]|uniref:Stage III sporulation protein AF n=1 Tax=Chengkuizengella axinellae TaxID=3064388 RepID=A0ABT9J3W7_9BACL|nr:stage III sporulation protein AF [Chengkuizengella sp. 2205SS18-9]MDP5275669.1 stage III sporulation protein AF [Chengkuizengella sp. 2205SS18-9]